MELSATAHVILGMLEWRPMSGYDIKSTVDNSARFFWAASYGQIYPELRRLAEAGLVEGRPEPQGGRKRTVYHLTAEGRRRLREWLAEDPEVFELRDEGLLKLFFAAATGGRNAGGSLEAKQRHHEEMVERLRAIEATGKPEGYAHMVLRYGIECNQWMARWCQLARAKLEEGDAPKRRAA
jgi:PadR family transcriptional regulator AphA